MRNAGRKPDHALKVIAGIFGSWMAIIVGLATADRLLPPNWRLPLEPLRFQDSGTFGDSFGVVSALMASVAAYFAYRAFNSSQEELATVQRRAGEPTFLDLLDRRFTLIDRVSKGQLKGTDAIINICNQIHLDVKRGIPPSKAYLDNAKGNGVRGLRNLFRFTYHSIRFAEDLFGYDPAAVGAAKRNNGSYPYVRLLRAQLSDDDLLLLALNTLYDPDGRDFGALLNRYALLDNMSEDDKVQYGFDKAFRGDEFGLPR